MGRILFYTQPPEPLRLGTDINDSEDWSTILIPSLPLPDVTRWIPSVEFEVAAIFEFSTTAIGQSKGDRYLNPTQSQIGYYQQIYNDFVYSHGRLLYSRQIVPLHSARVALPTSYANRKGTFRTVDSGGFDQAANSARFVMCETAREQQNGAPLRGQGADTQELQLRIERGKLELTPVEPSLLSFETLTIESGVHYPSRLSGVIWPGWTGTIALEFSLYTQLTIPGFLSDGELVQNPNLYPLPVRPCDGFSGDGGGPIVTVP